MKKEKGMIYSCFAGMGKTTLSSNKEGYHDLESSDYQWIYLDEELDTEARKGNDNKVRHPEFPKNYVDAIEQIVTMNTGQHALISSQPEVLAEIIKRGLDFITVTPGPELKEEYIQRYINRGNPDVFVDLMTKNFTNFSNDLGTNNKAVCNIIVRKENTFLADILN